MSDFVIEERRASDGLFPIVVRLSGKELPEGGRGSGGAFEIAPGTRQSEYWYPGVDEPTRHITGKKYAPMTIKGRLEDRFSAPGRAKSVALLVDRMVKQPVRISWGSWSFRGLIDVAKFGVETEASYSYAITFHIDAPDDQARPAPAAAVPSTPSDLREVTTAQREIVAEKVDQLPALVDDATASVLYEALLALLVATDAVLAVTDALEDGRTVSAEDLGRTLSLADAMALSAARARTVVASAPVPEGPHVAAQAMAWQEARAELIESCADLQAEALATAVRLDQLSSEGSPEAVYFAREGDTLESVARDRLGDQGRAADLARHNGLTNFRLAAGQRLVLPGRP